MFKRNFMMLRILSLALAIVMCLGFTGCKKTDDDDGSGYWVYESEIITTNDGDSNDADSQTSDGNQGGSNNAQTQSGSGNSQGKDSLENVKTKGKTFTILSSLLPTKEDPDNTLFEKVFFARVREVEKELDVKIKIINTIDPTPANLSASIMAGKKVADVIEVELRNMPALITSGYLKSWNEVPGINVNDSKYIKAYTKLGEIGAKNWGLQYMKPPEVRYCLVMNKNILKSAGIDADNIYNLIESKQWNWDTFLDYAKTTTNPSKGIYGIGGRPDYIVEMLMASNDAKLVTLDGNGKGTPSYTSSKVLESLNFMDALINKEKVAMITSSMRTPNNFTPADYIDEFISGKLAFILEDSWILNQRVKPEVKNFDYGMVMIPMGPSAKNYTSSSEHARVFVVTSTNKELDFTSKVFNALAESPKGYEGDQWWIDDVQADYFQKNDKKSIEMYKKSLDSASWDAGWGIDALKDGFKRKVVYESIVWTGGKTPEATINGIAGTYDKVITDVFK
jgi:hypothetical protein